MRFIIPTSEIQVGGSLHDFYYDLLVSRSDLSKATDNGNTIIEGDLILTLGQISSILTVGGEVYEYLLAIKADIAILGDDLPEGLPNRNTLDESGSAEIRKFKNWFDISAEVWKKDDNVSIYFVTNPIGTSKTKYLTGSQIALIYNSFKHASPLVIDRHCQVSKIVDFQAEVASGWIQIEF